MKIISFILVVVMVFVNHSIFSQYLKPEGAKNAVHVSNSEGLYAKFDSIILFTKYVNRSEGLNVQGFGFKGQNCIRLVVASKFVNDSLVFRRIKKVKGWFSVIEMENFNIQGVALMSDRALDLQFIPGTKHSVESVSGGFTYYLIYINNITKEEVVKSSSSPKFYQRNAPTWDRDMFIRLYDGLSYFFTP